FCQSLNKTSSKIKNVKMSNTEQEATKCISRFCERTADGESPFSGFPLCQEHLDEDLQRCENRKADILEKLDKLSCKLGRQSLQLEKQALAIEIQEIADMFDSIQENLQQWKEKLISSVQNVHDGVSDRLEIASESDVCAKDIATVSNSGNMRDLIQLTVSMESWLDAATRKTAEFDQKRAQLRQRQNNNFGIRSVGDVAAGVQHLQNLFDRHLNDVMKTCWLDDGETKPTGMLEQDSEIGDLTSKPTHVAACTNTAGFFGDASGRVVRADSVWHEISQTLPQPCIFVAFENQSADHLLVLSLDGSVRLKCQGESVSGQTAIKGFECDSRRQLLYVGRANLVSVADLSGTLLHTIDGERIKRPFGTVHGMTANSDKLFMLCATTLMCINKDSLLVDSEIRSRVFNCLTSASVGVGLHGGKIILSDAKLVTQGKTRKYKTSVYKICSVSGELICCVNFVSSLLDENRHMCQVSVSNTGFLFLCNLPTLRVLSGYNFESLASTSHSEAPSDLALLQSQIIVTSTGTNVFSSRSKLHCYKFHAECFFVSSRSQRMSFTLMDRRGTSIFEHLLVFTCKLNTSNIFIDSVEFFIEVYTNYTNDPCP
ncbi:hypothetical protein BOX15_Mlig018798g5, partial [Macrostomum lignano]